MFSIHHRHTVSLDPKLSDQFDRLLAILERAGDGMTDDEQQAVLDRARGQAERLHAITQEPPVK